MGRVGGSWDVGKIMWIRHVENGVDVLRTYSDNVHLAGKSSLYIQMSMDNCCYTTYFYRYPLLHLAPHFHKFVAWFLFSYMLSELYISKLIPSLEQSPNQSYHHY